MQHNFFRNFHLANLYLIQEVILKKHHVDPKGCMRGMPKLIILRYYIATASVTLCTYSYFLVTIHETFEALLTCFLWHSVGMVPGRDCSKPPDVQLWGFNVPASASFFLQGLFHVIVLIFVINCFNNRLCRKWLPNSKSRCHEQSLPLLGL